MAHTFFDGKSTMYSDKITLTRFGRKCLEISTVNFKVSCEVPIELREKEFLPGWSYICLTRDEVKVLRDQLTRFLEGDVTDSSPMDTFES